MKILQRFLIAAGLVSLAISPASASDEEMSLVEFQQLFLGQNVMPITGYPAGQLEALTIEQWQAFYDMFDRKGEFKKALDTIDGYYTKPDKSRLVYGVESIPVSTSVAGEFEPNYPDDDFYVDYVYSAGILAVGFTTDGIFWLPDDDEVGIQDDRCEDDIWAAFQIAKVIIHAAAITAQTACDASVLGAQVALCPVAGVAWGLDYYYVESCEACEAHAGNVDAAEIEAAYENSRTILDKSNSIKSDTGNILIDTGIIRPIVQTETNFTDDSELALHEAAVLDAIADLDAKLDTIDGKLDTVIDLLKTPSGRRDDWNQEP